MKRESNKDQLAILEADAANRINKDFPALYWDKFVMIDTSKTRLGIDDISYRARFPIEEDVAHMQMACRGWLETYDATDLVYALEGKLKKLFKALDRRRTVVVFPGTGAQVVRELLPGDLTKGMGIVNLPTQRKVSQNGSIEGVALGGKTALRQEITDRKAEVIVVVDDVIVTGSTLIAIQQEFSAKNIEWFGTSLMMLSPLQRKRGK